MSSVSARPAPSPSADGARRAVPGRFDEVDPTQPPGLVTALVLVSAAAVLGAVSAGPAGVAVLLGVCALAFPAGWMSLLEPARPTLLGGVLAITGVLMAAAVALSSGTQRLSWLPVLVAAGMIAAFFFQIIHAGGRDRLTVGMAATLSGLLALASGAAFAPLALAARGTAYVGVAMAAVAAAALVEAAAAPRSVLRRWALWIVMIVGGIVGWALAGMAGIAAGAGLGLGVLVASFSLSVRRVFAARPAVFTPGGALAVAVSSVLCTGVLVLALGGTLGISPS